MASRSPFISVFEHQSFNLKSAEFYYKILFFNFSLLQVLAVWLVVDILKEASVAGQQIRRLGSWGLCHARQHNNRPGRGWRWRIMAVTSRRDSPSGGPQVQRRGIQRKREKFYTL